MHRQGRLTTRMNGIRPPSAIGMKSLTGSYGSFLYIVALIASDPLPAITSV